jgi:hypothetical protein
MDHILLPHPSRLNAPQDRALADWIKTFASGSADDRNQLWTGGRSFPAAVLLHAEARAVLSLLSFTVDGTTMRVSGYDGGLGLDRAELEQLAEHLAPVFAERKAKLLRCGAELVVLGGDWSFGATVGPEVLWMADFKSFLPAARELRQFYGVLEMQLYAWAGNTERQRQGKLLVQGGWLWGQGDTPATWPALHYQCLQGEQDAWLQRWADRGAAQRAALNVYDARRVTDGATLRACMGRLVWRWSRCNVAQSGGQFSSVSRRKLWELSRTPKADPR